MNKIIACTFITCLGVIAYAGHNVAGTANNIAQSQVQSALLACAENPTCNDPEGGTK